MKHYELKLNGIEIEAIDIIKAKLTPEELKGFLMGNILKYLIREGNKQGNTALEDLNKGRWYLDYLIREIENEL